MTLNELKETIEEAGYEPKSYSGRGMYGKACVGFNTDDAMPEVVANLIESATVNNPILAHAVRHMKTDGFGVGTVYYFPRVKWED